MLWLSALISLSVSAYIFVQTTAEAGPSFSIDLEHNTFIKDGRPFRYISGSILYSRVPHLYWEDRLRKMYAAGLDAIQVYVPWNVHEPEKGQFEFEGQNDLVRFLQLADDVGLLVILRAGPYICAEWDYGGFPYWLKRKNESMVLRSMDPGYIKPMTDWFAELLPRIKPMLYNNGGPVIMVQVENEYGSYRGVTCDHRYMGYLRDLFRSVLGGDVVLFTTDGSGESYLQCGAIDGVYATVDFGPGNATRGFAAMRKWNPKGPLVNSEYYTGWLDAWGGNWTFTSTAAVTRTLKDMLDMGANVNMYTFEGGTNFGFVNGADPPYKPVVTSYDFDAPLSEAGDITLKYMAIRSLLSQYKPVPHDVPPNVTKEDYGIISMKKVTMVTDALDILSPDGYIETTYPITMEQARQPYGFVLYRHILKTDMLAGVLDLSGVRDRAHVMLGGKLVGLVYRNTPPMSIHLTAKKGDVLDILVENMGRINYGGQINQNQKGLISNVTLNNVPLTSWRYYNLELTTAGDFINERSGLGHVTDDATNQPPTLYSSTFVIGPGQVPSDTFLNVCGWNKGQAVLNGFNLGRYWPTLGPQVTLYVPGLYINPYPQSNTLTLLELDGASNCQVKGHDQQHNRVKGQDQQQHNWVKGHKQWIDYQVKGHNQQHNRVKGHKQWMDYQVKGQQTACTVRLQKESIVGGKCSEPEHIVSLHMENTGREAENRINNVLV